MFLSLSRRTNSSRVCRGVCELELRGRPTCAMFWTRAASASRTPEKVWLRSAGTSARSPVSGCGARPRATRVSWTSSSACLPRLRPSARPHAAGRTPRGDCAARVKSTSRGSLPWRGRGSPPCFAGPRPWPGAARLRRRRPPSTAGASTAGSGRGGQGAPDLGPGDLQVGLGVDHGRLLDVNLDLVRLLVELDEQVPLLHSVVVIDQDATHQAWDPRGHERHVAVDVRVIGGDGVQHGLHVGDQGVPAGREADHDPRQQQPFAPRARRRPAVGDGVSEG